MAKSKKNKKKAAGSRDKCKPECEHDWHLIKVFENFILHEIHATFICPKCGRVKRIEGTEEI